MNTIRSSLAVHLGLTAIYFSWLFGCAAKSAEETQRQAERDSVSTNQVAAGPAQKPSKLVAANKKPAAAAAQKPVAHKTPEQAAAEPAPTAKEKSPGVQTVASGTAKKATDKKIVATSQPQARKVVADVVNIRAKPSTNAAIVGKLTRGTSLPVQVEGQWAKLGENQYVLAKYFASNK